MKIASWNVNSVKVRLPHLLDFLQSAQPDVMCLQEIKCLAEDFPRLRSPPRLSVEAIGQRAYNGVALVSKQPARDLVVGLPGFDDDDQARYIEALFARGRRRRGAGRLGSICRTATRSAPTNSPTSSPGWSGWSSTPQALLRREIPFVLAGDYNVCPADEDVYDPVAWRDDALCRIESRARFRALLYLGLTDAYRVFHRESHRYTFWDYQAGRWNRDEGLRIDHLLLSPQAADRVAACDIDKAPRGKERASDHTPIWCELAI